MWFYIYSSRSMKTLPSFIVTYFYIFRFPDISRHFPTYPDISRQFSTFPAQLFLRECREKCRTTCGGGPNEQHKIFLSPCALTFNFKISEILEIVTVCSSFTVWNCSTASYYDDIEFVFLQGNHLKGPWVLSLWHQRGSNQICMLPFLKLLTSDF